ncbi:MAG TPA: RHS repeat-associated core domain-containing protein [Rudaea sp.]|uniref:RHS repeat-associated core domain-containing protein n=1 Tax=Rudaea sp. TaxID=2136325 RepID=UPI002F93BE51
MNKLRLLAIFVLFFGITHAAYSNDIWSYCTYNFQNINACFDSLDAAEAYMQQENPSSPSGRAFLELTSGPTFSGSVTNPTGIVYSYSVKPRGPMAYLEDYIRAITLGWGGYPPQGSICGCPNPDGTGTASCLPYGTTTTCQDIPAVCNSCKVQNGDTSVIQSAIRAYVGNACGLSIGVRYPWPSPADSSGGFSINGMNFQGLYYGNGWQGTGDVREPFNYELLVSYGSLSNGQCSNVVPRITYGVDRWQHIQCDAGLSEVSATLNPQNYYSPSQVTPINQLCRSNATDTIVASLVPSNQCSYGNPCVPGNGSKVDDEVDYSFGSFTLGRHYNSLRLALTNSYLGPSWQSDFDSRLIIPNSTSSTYVLLLDSHGNIERFDQQGATTTYRSVNVPGWILSSVTVSSTTTWHLLTSSAELWTFNNSGVLLTTQSINRPETLHTFVYGPVYSASGSLVVPAGAPQTVTDATGRSLQFTYDLINSGSACSGCSGMRLTSVLLPDGNSLNYTYDILGNLQVVIFPDGNSRQYFYNEPANICPGGSSGACSGGAPPSAGFPHLLTGISDVSIASGSPVATRFSTYQYDYRGRVISSSQAGGANQLTLSYPSPTQTLLNFAFGNPSVAGMQKTVNLTSIGGIFRKETVNADKDPITGNSNPTQYAYDTLGRVMSKTDSLNVVHSYEYSNTLNLTATTDAVGTLVQRRVETDWNDSFNVPTERRIKNGGGVVETKTDWAYNARGQVLSRCEVDPAVSGASSYACGSSMNALVGVRQWAYTYCEQAGVTAGTCPLVGLLLSVDGPRTDVSDVTTYTYYQATDVSGCATFGGSCHYLGDLYKVTNALGQVTTYVSYDQNGRVTRILDANGTYTDMTYHSRGWLLTRSTRANPDGSASSSDATTTFAYDNVGNVTQITQPDGAYFLYTYDAAHRLTDISDNVGNRIHYTLDAAGNRTSESTYDPNNTLKRALSRQYDQLNHLTKTLNASSAAVQTYQNPADAPPSGITYTDGYDGNGNAIYSVDGLSTGTEQQYDPLNRLIKTLQDHTGKTTATKDTTTQYAYDARDNLRSVSDPNGLVTNYTYDGLNNLTALQSPDTGNASYVYDAVGNRITQTDARGIVTAYAYDALNRLTAIGYPTGSLNVSYAYDQANSVTGCASSYPLGRLTKITDNSGSAVYCYDRRVNVLQKKQTAGSVISTASYTYTLADHISTITYPSGAIVTYARNALGQITNISYKANATANAQVLVGTTTYLPFGPLNQLTFGNGRTQTKTYDSDYAIDKVLSSGASGLILDTSEDVLGNLINASSTVGASPPTQTYQYDPLYRLTTIQNGKTMSESFTYNQTGDRLTDTSGRSTATYSYPNPLTSHHLQSVAGNARSYDANGNLQNTAAGTLTYDARNRLVGLNTSATKKKTPQATYNYNGKGERVIKAVGTAGNTLTPTTFVYSEGGQLLGEYAAAGNKEYIYLDSVPVGIVTISGSATQLYYLETDQLGTPREAIKPGATPASDTLVWRWDYFGSAFGNSTANPQTLTVNLRFSGQYYDAETGLNYNYYRDYEPVTGRYVESDPIGQFGGVNMYAFTGNAPLTGIDPYGLIKIYGNWCGPDWTGGYTKPWNDLAQYEEEHVKPPIDQLDGACKNHDLCYGKCGVDFPCDPISRSQCFRRCDHILTDAAYHVGGFWGLTVGAAIDRPGSRDPGANALGCCDTKTRK